MNLLCSSHYALWSPQLLRVLRQGPPCLGTRAVMSKLADAKEWGATPTHWMRNHILKSSQKTALKAGGDSLIGRREQQDKDPHLQIRHIDLQQARSSQELPLLKLQSLECWVRNACPYCIWSKFPSERDGQQLRNVIIWWGRYSRENYTQSGVVEAVRCYQFP